MQMSSPNPARKNTVLLGILLIGQLLLMSGSSRRHDGATVLESVVMWTTSPLVRAAGAVGDGIRGGMAQVYEIFQARSENDYLRDEVRRLRAEAVRMRESDLENARLRRLLGMRENLAPEAVGAKVVNARLHGQERLLVINRGTLDGVRVDRAVVAYGGVVGRVVHSDAMYAKVRVLTDPNSGVGGVIQRIRAEGMVFGFGRTLLEMDYVSRFADIRIGDRVVTSGLDGIFPRGFTIGRITFVGDEDEEVSKEIRLQPAVDFSSLEEVLVLLEPAGGPLLSPEKVLVDR
jgi:rod shape-determining protein MreC